MINNPNEVKHILIGALIGSVLSCLITMVIMNTIPQENTNEIQFIWNDDEESIPPDNSLITLEFTDENTVYIGPYDNKANTDNPTDYTITFTSPKGDLILKSKDTIYSTNLDNLVETIEKDNK